MGYSISKCGRSLAGKPTATRNGVEAMKRYIVLLVLGWATVLSSAQDFSALVARADAGDLAAQLQVANAYDMGRGVPADTVQAVTWLRRAADGGSAEAQNLLGVKYRRGEGVPKDLVTAARWYRQAAKLGNAEAMFNLGAAYYNGDGVLENSTISLAWFLVAAEFGSKSAPDAVQHTGEELPKSRKLQALLRASDMLVGGEQVPSRPELAFKILNQAVSLGSHRAEIGLAELYWKGLGVPRNPSLALQSCQDGAAQGIAPAMTCLGEMYQSGDGLPQDAMSAYTWYQKGAACGEAKSVFQVGKMLEDGSAGATDKVEAFADLLLAGSALPQAMHEALAIGSQLSDEELKIGEKKADALLAKIQANACTWAD